jgi:putative spermidine/putrescine transport system permease protein
MRRANFAAPATATGVVAITVAALILAPLAIVIPMSFSGSHSFEFPPPSYWLGHYRAYFSSESWLRPTFNSFAIGVVSSLLTLAVATPAAFAVNRREFKARRTLQIVLLLPMLIPSIVMAISYYTVFGRIGLNQTYTGVVLAHTCVSIPVVVIAMSASLQNLDPNLERAAIICGATPTQTFVRVTLPLLRPAFLIAGFFAFIHSFDEATISLFISSREVSTLPRRMFSSIHLEADPVVAVVSSIMIMVAITIVATAATVRHYRAAGPIQ